MSYSLKMGRNHFQMPISELKEWAIGYKRNNGEVLNLTKGKKLFLERHIGVNTHVCGCKK